MGLSSQAWLPQGQDESTTSGHLWEEFQPTNWSTDFISPGLTLPQRVRFTSKLLDLSRIKWMNMEYNPDSNQRKRDLNPHVNQQKTGITSRHEAHLTSFNWAIAAWDIMAAKFAWGWWFSMNWLDFRWEADGKWLTSFIGSSTHGYELT